MDKTIFWNGFLKHAAKEYPKEACAFLFSKLPYSQEEEWFVFAVKNIAENPKEAWIPDKQEMLKIKAKSIKLGLVKIGNVHTHPYSKEWGVFNEDTMKEIIQPSDIDLKFARKFNDVVRIIVCIDDKAVYGFRELVPYKRNPEQEIRG
mgnify:CR=1 FL=1